MVHVNTCWTCTIGSVLPGGFATLTAGVAAHDEFSELLLVVTALAPGGCVCVLVCSCVCYCTVRIVVL